MHFAAVCVEDSRRRFRARKLAIVERYVKSELEIVLKVCSPRHAGVWDFVFRAIPDRRPKEGNFSVPCRTVKSSDLDIVGDAANKCDERMFAHVAEIVQIVEVVIPSFVWRERPKERLDFRWEILRTTPHAVFETSGGSSEREMDLLNVGVSRFEVSSRPGGMIQTRSEVFNDLSSEQSPAEWKPLSQLDFVNFVNAIRVEIDDFGVWLFSKVAVDLGVEVFEMFLCACDPDLGPPGASQASRESML